MSDFPAETAWQQSTAQPQVREPERFDGHRVRLELWGENAFEGPLDLLLYLVRAHRYDICDIPIHDITRQFLGFSRLIELLDLDAAGDFLVTAATLMQIKSRMLLPKNESANEDAMQVEADDPRRELVDRLLEYQRFQSAAQSLQELKSEREQLFARRIALSETIDDLNDGELPPTLALQNVSSFDLLRALQRVLDRMQEAPVALVQREPFTIATRTREVWTRLKGLSRANFELLCDDCQSRLEVVITFLSILELIRRGRVEVEQEIAFGEIELRARLAG